MIYLLEITLSIRIIFHLVGDSGGDGVQLALSSLGDLATSITALLNKSSRLEGLQSGAHRVGGRSGESVGSSTASLSASELDAQVTNSDTLVQVNLTGNSGTSDVEPVGIVGGQILVGSGLHDVAPGRDFDLSSLLELGSIGSDELISSNILKGNSSGHFGSMQPGNANGE